MIVAKMGFRNVGGVSVRTWKALGGWAIKFLIESEATPDLPSGFTPRNANLITTLGGDQKQMRYTGKKRKHGGACTW